jgi:hypothetical protein
VLQRRVLAFIITRSRRDRSGESRRRLMIRATAGALLQTLPAFQWLLLLPGAPFAALGSAPLLQRSRLEPRQHVATRIVEFQVLSEYLPSADLFKSFE